MKYREVLSTLGYLLMLFSTTFFLPIFVGVAYHEPPMFLYKSYIIPFLVTGLIGCIMWYNSRHERHNLRERDAYVVVGLGWLLIAFFGSLPYMTGGMNPLDAYFESMSGFTTTGASIIPPGSIVDGAFVADYYPAVYSHSLIFWRALTNWLGGLGIIILGVVILAKFMHGGAYLFKAELGGASMTKLRPKLYDTARILWAVYAFLTLLCMILYLGAGMPLYDAICTAMPTLASGGFTTHGNSIAVYASPTVEMIAIVFMIISGVNFVINYRFITGRYKDALDDPELKFFLIWVTFMTSLVILGLAISRTMGVTSMLRNGAFHAVSAATNTGFTIDNSLGIWPPFVHLILIFLMLAGGMVGSTCGGLKTSRIMVLLKNLKNGLIKAIHPRAVTSVKIGGKAVPENTVARIQILLLIFIMLLSISVLLLCATGISITDSLSAVASCMTNTGIGIFSPGVGFHTLNPFAKAVLIVCMWMGRLEIFTALIILAPSTYKR